MFESHLGLFFALVLYHFFLRGVRAISILLHYVRSLVPIMLSSQDGDVDSMDFRANDFKYQRALNLNRDVGMDDEIARFKKDETNVRRWYWIR